MKKILLSLMAMAVLVGGTSLFAADATPTKAEAAATVIAQLLNEKDQEYVQKFYTLFDKLVADYTEKKDEKRLTLLDEMKQVFLAKVFYAPAGYDTSCMDTSKPVKACTMEYAPICGEDVHTYGNKCSLEAAGVKALHEGECKAEDKPQVCTLEYAPICGTDGKTYGNLCSLKASDAGLLFAGTCESNLKKLSCVHTKTPAIAACTREYNPVCGTDGKTYDNPCLAKAASVDYTDGACIVAKCTKDYVPVCWKNGQTYSNSCLADAAGASVDYEGICKEAR